MSLPSSQVMQPVAGGDIKPDLDPKKLYTVQLKTVKEATKAVFQANKKLDAAMKAGKKLAGLDGITEFNKADLAHYEAQLLKEISTLDKTHKAVVKGKKRNSSGASHLSKPYFVSKQVVDFFSQTLTTYGGMDSYNRVQEIWANPNIPVGQKESECLAFLTSSQGSTDVRSGVASFTSGIYPYAPEEVQTGCAQLGGGTPVTYDFFNHGLASGQLLMQLFRLYLISRGLQSKTNSTYYNYDKVFVDTFGPGTNTHLILMQDGGKSVDLTAQNSQRFAGRSLESLTDSEKKLAEKLDPITCDKDALARLRDKAAGPGKKTSSFVEYDQKRASDAWGIAMPGIARFINFFRIPNELLPAQQADYLSGKYDWREMRVVVDSATGSPVVNPATGQYLSEPVDKDDRTYARRKMDDTLLYVAGKKAKDKAKTLIRPGLLDAYKYAVHESSAILSKNKRTEGAARKKAEAERKSRQAVSQQQASTLTAMLPSTMFNQK